MANSVPQIMLLQPEIGMQADLLKDLYGELLTEIGRRFRTSKVDFKDSTDLFLNGKPSVVLAVDGLLSAKKYESLHQQLAQYTKNGGTVIFCWLFSSLCRPIDMCRLFTSFGLQWKCGDYHRTTFALNEAFQPVFGNQLYSTLESSYCVKALHVKHVPRNARVYSPAPSSRTQSFVFRASPVDQSQSSAVFTRCGQGFIGYTGDVNNEGGTTVLLLAMTETALRYSEQNGSTATAGSTQKLEPVIFNPGCFVCGKLEPARKCSRCQKVQYCSTTCQKAAWNGHKEVCNKPASISEEEVDEEEDGTEEEDW